jgi:hypothetical protein
VQESVIFEKEHDLLLPEGASQLVDEPRSSGLTPHAGLGDALNNGTLINWSK